MTLAASKGTEIKIQCTGENSQEDLSKLVNLIKNNFGEENHYLITLLKKSHLQVYLCPMVMLLEIVL